MLHGQIQQHVDRNKAVDYGSFTWAAPMVSFPKIQSIHSLSIQGFIPAEQVLTISCKDRIYQEATFGKGYFSLNQKFSAACPGGDLAIRSSYQIKPGETVGSRDQRILSNQFGLVSINATNIPIDQLVPLSAGLYGAEENISRVSVNDILTNTHDSGWYYKIAKNGYSFDGDKMVQQTVAWPFLYPYLTKAVHRVTGKSIQKSMIVLSGFASFVAMLGLFFLGRELKLSAGLSLLAPVWFAFNPFSFFVFGGFSESLFMLLFSMALILIIREKWYLAAMAIAAMTTSRFVGGISILLLMVHWLSINYKKQNFLKVAMQLSIFGFIAVIGILIDVAVKYHAVGEPFAAFVVRSAWKVTSFDDLQKIINLNLIKSGEYLPVLMLTAILLLYSISMSVYCLRRGNSSAAVVSGSGAVILLATLVVNPEIHSAGRYALVLAPCISGLLCCERFRETSVVLVSTITAIGAAFSGIIVSNIYAAAAPF